jgi:ectoine hydroxylase-related dioxygenase (phytanoyl-CoA dioxygenase family)
MSTLNELKDQITRDGFTILNDVFPTEEIDAISLIISKTNSTKPTFRKTNDLFAIRQFLKELPEVRDLIFTQKLNSIIADLFGNDYAVVKSIYFDKPGQSNWFVAYHQDLTISVAKKIHTEGFSAWTIKEGQFAVQPPAAILENNFTIRIHLDDTNQYNGALKVIPGSHARGICRLKDSDDTKKTEIICTVKKGGLMIMRPLLLHASNKTTNNQNRRVIHIEFSNCVLPNSLQWSEKM